MPHGKPKNGFMVVSTTIEEELKEILDQVKEEKGYKTRSALIRKAIIEYITKFKEYV